MKHHFLFHSSTVFVLGLIGLFSAPNEICAQPVDLKLKKQLEQLFDLKEAKKRPPSYFDSALIGINIREIKNHLPKTYHVEPFNSGSIRGIYDGNRVYIQKNTAQKKGPWVLLWVAYKKTIYATEIRGEKVVSRKEAKKMQWTQEIGGIISVYFFTDRTVLPGSTVLKVTKDDAWDEHYFKRRGE